MNRYDIAMGKTPPAPMRNIGVVIDQIKALIPIPASYSTGLFIEQLDWTKRDSLYKAPEQQSECWLMLRGLLIEFIPRPEEEWEYQILALFSKGSVELIKQYWKIEHPHEVMIMKGGVPHLTDQRMMKKITA